jgi:hypothetical protein
MGIWGAIKKVLGTLTDILLVGRSAGLWDKGQGPDIGGDSPRRPDIKPPK